MANNCKELLPFVPVVSSVVGIIALIFSGLTFYRNFVYKRGCLHAVMAGVAAVSKPDSALEFVVEVVNTGNRECKILGFRLHNRNLEGWTPLLGRALPADRTW